MTHTITPKQISREVYKCDVCGRQISQVFGYSNDEFYWRHKGTDYKWGDKAKNAEKKYASMLSAIKAQPDIIIKNALLAILEAQEIT